MAIKTDNKFEVHVMGSQAVSNAISAFNLFSKNLIGEKIGERVHYSFVEALYLLKMGKIELLKNKKNISADSFMRLAERKEKNFFARYSVYEDLKNKGYIAKTALKFGADFRVYDKGKKPGEEHAKWIVFAVYGMDSLTWHEFTAKNRVAHTTKKNLLIAIVDEEGDVTYYEITWLRP